MLVVPIRPMPDMMQPIRMSAPTTISIIVAQNDNRSRNWFFIFLFLLTLLSFSLADFLTKS